MMMSTCAERKQGKRFSFPHPGARELGGEPGPVTVVAGREAGREADAGWDGRQRCPAALPFGELSHNNTVTTSQVISHLP